MTRTVSGFKIKRSSKSSAHIDDGKPALGTKIREKYDALRRGEIVSLGGDKGCKAVLRDFYGMDTEAVKIGGKIVGSRLLGEWEGPYYVPIERIVAGAACEQ